MYEIRTHARSDGLDAVERILIGLGVVPCLVLIFPLHVIVLGTAAALRALALTALFGLILVEIVVSHWRRIPFTCTYIPAKRQLVHSLLLTFSAFTVFVSIGSLLVDVSLRRSSWFAIVLGILLVAIVGMRRNRATTWGKAPLEFEDGMPDDVTVIPLSPQ
jgi:hypothetical protein